MKKLLFITATLIVTSIFAFANITKDITTNDSKVVETAPQKAKITWAMTQKDFGKIEQGVPVDASFEFTNTGSSALLITNVKTSCGCTASEWPREAVQPGETATIKATYNAAKVGNFTKSITVMSNAEEAVYALRIKGEVVAKK